MEEEVVSESNDVKIHSEYSSQFEEEEEEEEDSLCMAMGLLLILDDVSKSIYLLVLHTSIA